MWVCGVGRHCGALPGSPFNGVIVARMLGARTASIPNPSVIVSAASHPRSQWLRDGGHKGLETSDTSHLARLGITLRAILTLPSPGSCWPCIAAQFPSPSIQSLFLLLLSAGSDSKGMCVCVLSHFSRVLLFATLWTVACQAPLSMGILQARILV